MFNRINLCLNNPNPHKSLQRKVAGFYEFEAFHFLFTCEGSSFRKRRYLNNIAIRHVKIIPNARRKNIPLVSPRETVCPMINFNIIRKISNPNRINTKAFEGFK